jgi:mRNA interferase RelE/StbE
MGVAYRVALTFLSQNPFSEVLQVKKLRGEENLYRIRLGDYRLVYEVRRKEILVLVIKIGHRSDVYC